MVEPVGGLAPGAAIGELAYTSDLSGNRLTRTGTLVVPGPQSCSYDANDRLDSDTYDANGNTLASQAGADVYDWRNRLVQRTRADGTLVTLLYDGDGNLVAETANGVRTWFIVDTQSATGYSQVVEEHEESLADRSLTLTTVYAYGHDLISRDRVVVDEDTGTADWQAH